MSISRFRLSTAILATGVAAFNSGCVCPEYDTTRVFPHVAVDRTDVQIGITLASITYLGRDSNPAGQETRMRDALAIPELPTANQWELVWGPVNRNSNLMYVVRGPVSGTGHRYAVAIRGTIPKLQSILEDIELNQVELPWSSSTAPDDVRISRGICTGFRRLRDLKHGGKTVVEFLSAAGDVDKLMVTGHSLGGCLTTVMALYLGDTLTGPVIRAIPFAGQTAGNATFAMWYAERFGGNSRWANRYDIVPRAWSEDSLESIKALYPGGPSCPDTYKDLVDVAMEVVGDCFFQPGPGTTLNGEMYRDGGSEPFLKEIGAQHNHIYYLFLTGVPKSVCHKLDTSFEPPVP